MRLDQPTSRAARAILPVRQSATFVLTLLLLAGATTGALSQEATPVTTPAAGTHLDLAAMTLRPEDIDGEEFGFSLHAWATHPDGWTAQMAAALDLPHSVLAAKFGDAGLLAQHHARIAVPDPVETYREGRAIWSYVAQYATEDGAARTFALLEDRRDLPRSQIVTAPRSFGDQTAIIRSSVRELGDQGEVSFERLELIFRSETLLASIWIEQYSKARPEVPEVEKLARRLLGRIDTGRRTGGPGLSTKTLSLQPTGSLALWTMLEHYLRLDGTSARYFGDSEQDLATREVLNAGPVDIFYISQIFQPVPAWPEDQRIRLYLFTRRYVDEQAASAYMRGLQARYAAYWAERYPGDPNPYTLVESAPTFGNESTILAFHPSESTIQGYLVFVRVGNLVGEFVVDAHGGVTFEAVEELAKAQAACLEHDACEARLPEDLFAARGGVRLEGPGRPSPDLPKR